MSRIEVSVALASQENVNPLGKLKANYVGQRTRSSLSAVTNNSQIPRFEKNTVATKATSKRTTDAATKETLPHVSEGQVKIEKECHSKSKEDKVDDEKRDVVDIDAEDLDNPFCCAEYAEEIYRYLKKREKIYQVPDNYIQSHKEINERMRAILVDWLVSVHDKFKLTQETLFLAVSILDRYLAENREEKKSNLQLVGVTAIFLASKIEDIYAPELSELAYITDHSCSSAMIKSCERKMSAKLDFNFGDPLCIHFLRRNSKALKATAEQHALAKYFMELMLLDYDCCVSFPPSQRAAAALCVAMRITDGSSWNAILVHYSSYTEASLKTCMVKIANLVLKSVNQKSQLASVRRKYSKARFGHVATSPCLTSAFLYELPETK